MIRLYFTPNSTFSRRVRIALLEKDIPFEPRPLDFPGGEHKKPPYLATNPYGRIPAIDDDGFVLYESTAILEYLEAKHPQPALVPADLQGRALVAMHMKLCDLQLGVHTRALIFPTRFVPRESWNLAAMAEARGEMARHLDIVERELEGREFLVGDRFTLADICYMPILHFLPRAEVALPPAVAAWAQRLLARPSAQATVPPR